jgi:hypothetical protein
MDVIWAVVALPRHEYEAASSGFSHEITLPDTVTDSKAASSTGSLLSNVSSFCCAASPMTSAKRFD